MAGRSVVIVGAGMGGLTAALRLARAGLSVRVLEARSCPGGLAGGLELEGLPFDAGPYILLDRPGLEWAFRSAGLELAQHVTLRKIEDIYEVRTPDGTPVRFQADLEMTAAGFDKQWPGSGARYIQYVNEVTRIYRRLEPLQRVSRPGLWSLIKGGGWRDLPFLLRSLHQVLAATGLPPPVRDALAIWTHVAGQRVEQAPSPLAFVPALFHGVGAYYPRGGISTIPRVLAEEAVRAGVALDYGVKVTAIRSLPPFVRGGRGGKTVVETARGDALAVDAVLSNASGLGTHLELTDRTPPAAKTCLEQLPLQSPGVAAYLAVKGSITPPYLRFYLPGGDERCRCLVLPSVMEPEVQKDGWYPARLIVPMDHARAHKAGADGQRRYLDDILAESWWREQFDDHHVLATRTPTEWGAQYHLFRDSMNPVMTARFMRAGRLAHRSPYQRGLYLAGSATHPGQWVSFCAISGILAANQLLEDLA